MDVMVSPGEPPDRQPADQARDPEAPTRATTVSMSGVKEDARAGGCAAGLRGGLLTSTNLQQPRRSKNDVACNWKLRPRLHRPARAADAAPDRAHPAAAEPVDGSVAARYRHPAGPAR